MPEQNQVNQQTPAEKVHLSVNAGVSTLNALGGNLVRVPLAKKGSWKHDKYGEVSFNDNDFQNTLHNITSGSLGFPPYLTFGHLDEEPNSTDSSRKRGNLVNAFEDGDLLFGDFKVPPKVYTAVANGEYDYASGEYIRNYTNKNTGANDGTALVRVALTNAPFIPFGDTKVQALSINASDKSENCLQNDSSFVFSLNIDKKNGAVTNGQSQQDEETVNGKEGQAQEKEGKIPESQPQAINQTDVLDTNTSIEETTMSDSKNQVPATPQVTPAPGAAPAAVTKEPVVTEPAATPTPAAATPAPSPAATPTQPAASAATPVATSTEPAVTPAVTPVVPAAPASTPPSTVADTAIANLASQVQAIQTQYTAALGKANQTIATLAEQVATLTSELAGQKTVTQAYSQSVVDEENRRLDQHLISQGVTPAIVQKFSQLRSALTEPKQVVKLSTTAANEQGQQVTTEVDSTLITEIANLLVANQAAKPVIYEQLGQTSSNRAVGSLNFDEIIARNKAAVAPKTAA